MADGITYVLTEDDPFAAIDLDHCRDVNTAQHRCVGAEFSRLLAAIAIAK